MEKIKLIECPRDAMQGLHNFIETKDKIRYINSLLEVGFDTIDVGSFVSPRMIPQMRDTPEVLNGINWGASQSKLLTIVGNKKGAARAAEFEQVTYLGYPFSISETFQLRNTNASIEESLGRLADIREVCDKHQKSLVVYLSMGFGNPYGDPWSPAMVTEWTQRIKEDFHIDIISLSDTIGAADAISIRNVFQSVQPYTKDIEIGAHLHAEVNRWKDKVEAALRAGCIRFDGALKGLGGCPYAADDLKGNIPTELMVPYFEGEGYMSGVNHEKLAESVRISQDIFN